MSGKLEDGSIFPTKEKDTCSLLGLGAGGELTSHRDLRARLVSLTHLDP